MRPRGSAQVGSIPYILLGTVALTDLPGLPVEVVLLFVELIPLPRLSVVWQVLRQELELLKRLVGPGSVQVEIHQAPVVREIVRRQGFGPFIPFDRLRDPIHFEEVKVSQRSANRGVARR